MAGFKISGNIVDIIQKKIFPGSIEVVDGQIISVTEEDGVSYDTYIMPGFVDAHVHIESSMLVPAEFARMAVLHGTVATVSDPHEIANVLGMAGIEFMIESGKQTPFKFYFGAPSCVPATEFETAGAKITPDNIRELLARDEIKYMSEMMNYPGVLYGFPDVLEKLAIARESGKPVDGHAPGLVGENIEKYINAGISTDHECVSISEAVEKMSNGMKILIREGSAAKNFGELFRLIELRPDMVMLCSDDKHPDDLANGHINKVVRRAVEMGVGLMKVLRATIINPIEHYNLNIGLLRPGDPADFIEVNNLTDFNVIRTYISGILVAENGKTLIPPSKITPINKFEALRKENFEFKVPPSGKMLRVIEAIEGELTTGELHFEENVSNGNVISDIGNDVLKMAVVNRYRNSRPGIGFIKNIGLMRGAIACSVAHDSHNIIAVGTTDAELCNAVNAIIESKGGMVVVDGNETMLLPLPVAGLMSDQDGQTVAAQYHKLNSKARDLGSTMNSPFMTLSFMALLVIPKLKLSDKGLFNSESFRFVELGV